MDELIKERLKYMLEQDLEKIQKTLLRKTSKDELTRVQKKRIT